MARNHPTTTSPPIMPFFEKKFEDTTIRLVPGAGADEVTKITKTQEGRFFDEAGREYELVPPRYTTLRRKPVTSKESQRRRRGEERRLEKLEEEEERRLMELQGLSDYPPGARSPG